MSRIVLICCFATFLGSCGASFQGADWGRARLACADLGLEPDTSPFDKCVFDLYYTLWDEQNAGER
jgi:hypothetical protein